MMFQSSMPNDVSCFQSQLADRKQLVSVGTGNSNLQRGLKRGSVLAPKLLSLHINDVSNILGFTHFVDDTTVYLSNLDFMYQ